MRKLLALLPVILACLLFVGTMSCTPTQPAKDGGSSVADGVPREAALAFAAAYAAFAALDATEAERLAAINRTGDPEKAKAAQPLAHKRNEQLHRVRDLLETARRWLSGDAQGGEQALRDGANMLRIVVDGMRAEGHTIPNEVSAGLRTLEVLL